MTKQNGDRRILSYEINLSSGEIIKQNSLGNILVALGTRLQRESLGWEKTVKGIEVKDGDKVVKTYSMREALQRVNSEFYRLHFQNIGATDVINGLMQHEWW